VERGAGGATWVLRDSTLARFLSRDFGAGLAAAFPFKRIDLGRDARGLAAFFTVFDFDLSLVAIVRAVQRQTAELIKVVALKVKLPCSFHLAEHLHYTRSSTAS
jgi:hypothetical protein